MVCYLLNSLALQNNPRSSKNFGKSHSTEIETFQRKASTNEEDKKKRTQQANSTKRTRDSTPYETHTYTHIHMRIAVTINGMLSEFENFNMF